MNKFLAYAINPPMKQPRRGTDPELILCTSNATLYIWNRETEAWSTQQVGIKLGATTPIIMTEFQGMGSGGNQYASYNTAIQEIAAADPYTYSVNTSGAGLRDVNHWNYAGMKQVAGAMLDIVESL